MIEIKNTSVIIIAHDMNRTKISSTKKKGLSSVFVSLLLSFVFVGLSCLLIVNSVKSVITAYRRVKLLDQAKEEVSDLRYRNLELLMQKEEIMGATYVEKEARDRLFYVKDGEVMVVVPESDEFNEVLNVADPRSNDEVQMDDNSWVEWWDLLKNGV